MKDKALLDHVRLNEAVARRARIFEARIDKGTVYARFYAGAPDVPLFTFFEDEISFEPDEFTGLTVREAEELRSKKSYAFLVGHSHVL